MGVLITGNEITLSGVVGGDAYWDDGFNSGDVINALASLGRDANIVLKINSGGGIATEGAAIHSALAAHKGTVQVIVEGIAASAASLIAMAADTILMAPGSIMMIHDPSGFTVGDAATHQKTIEALNALGDAYAGIYADRAGISQEDARAIMRAETWYTPESAVEAGFADAVGASNDNASDISAFAYGVYAHAPAKLVAMASANNWRPRASLAAPIVASRPNEKKMTMQVQEPVNDSAVNETDAAASTEATDPTSAVEVDAVATTDEPAAEIVAEVAGTVEAAETVEATPDETNPAHDLADAVESAITAGLSAKFVASLIRDGVQAADVRAKAALAGEFNMMLADARKISPTLSADVTEFLASGSTVDAARASLLDKIVAQQSPEVSAHVAHVEPVTASNTWDKAVAKINARLK